MSYMPGYPSPYDPYAGPQRPAQRPEPSMGYPIPPGIVQGPQMPPQGAQGLSPASRPVANREEANAIQADFSGAPMVFPDIAHNRVYIKRWNFNTGAADFFEYVPVAAEAASQQTPAWATLQDLQNLQDTVNTLRQELDRIKKAGGKAAKQNDEPK